MPVECSGDLHARSSGPAPRGWHQAPSSHSGRQPIVG
jgi:hypothetical protein